MKDVDGNIVEIDRPGLFPPPLAMEFEKAMLSMLCLTKKRYAAILSDKKGNPVKVVIKDDQGKIIKVTDEYDLLKRGIVLVRRDNVQILRKIYKEILIFILTQPSSKETFFSVISLVLNYLQKIYAGQIDYTEFQSTRKMGSNYKSSTAYMLVFANNMISAGKIITPGERLTFLVVKTANDNDKIGQKMRLVEYLLENRQNDQFVEQLDYDYYVLKVLAKPLNQLIYVGFKNIIDRMTCFNFKAPRKRKPYDMTTPVNLLVALLYQQFSIDYIKQTLWQYLCSL
jgi:DNA polymerase elongation subunit (family B)